MAVDLRQLVKAGVHFGHRKSGWCPKMKEYIWGVKNKVHLIDVSITAAQIEKASNFLKDITADGKQVLWIGTKKSAQQIIQDAATKLEMPYVNHRWVGGTLSNYAQVKKSITKWSHLEDVLEKSEKNSIYTKKELNVFKKMIDRLKKSIGGLKKMSWGSLGAIVLVDVDKEYSALLEANTVGIPVIALVDTNSDPSLVDYVIPANDDSAQSISIVIENLSKATAEGVAVYAKKVEAEKKVAATQKLEKKADKEKSESTATAAATEKKKVEAVKKSTVTVKKETKPEATKVKEVSEKVDNKEEKK